MSSVRCNYCKELGHMKFNCPKKKKTQSQYPTSSQTSASAITEVPVTPADAVPVLNVGSAPSSSVASPAVPPEMIQQWIPFIHAMSSALPSGTYSFTWLIDSGASNHMTGNVFLLTKSTPFSSSSSIFTADGTALSLSSFGNMFSSCSSPSLSLTGVFHVPRLAMNFLSLGQLFDHGCTITFSHTGCLAQDQLTGKTIGRG